MKLLLTFFLIFYLLPGFAQQQESHFAGNAELTLVAKNNKHTRRYRNGEFLKIFYHDSSRVVKAKGSLLIYNDKQIMLMPVRKKDIITINVNDIASVGLWKRNIKTASAIIGGTGAAAIGLVALMEQPQRSGTGETNLIGFGLMVYSVVILWYEIIAVPAIFLSEHVGIRSEKKGYRFFIEEH